MSDISLEQYTAYVWGKYQKERTRTTYLCGPRSFVRHTGKSLDATTPQDVQGYVAWNLKHRKHNGNTLRFWSLRKCFATIGRPDLVESFPHLRWVDAGKPALREPELDKIFGTVERMSPLHRLIFYLENDTIRRPSEIINIRLDDRDDHLLRYLGKTQGRVGVKYCVMTKRLMQAWDNYLAVRPLPASPEDAPYLLINSYGQYKGTRMRQIQTLTNIIKEVMMYAGVNLPMGERPNNYLVKRTTITRQLLGGADIKIVQAQAGHIDPKATLKYHRIAEEDIKIYLGLWEDKTQKINAKVRLGTAKSVYSPEETPQTCTTKTREGKTDNSKASFSFDSFSSHHQSDRLDHRQGWSAPFISTGVAYSYLFLPFVNAPAPLLQCQRMVQQPDFGFISSLLVRPSSGLLLSESYPPMSPARDGGGMTAGDVATSHKSIPSPFVPGPHLSDSLFGMDIPTIRGGAGMFLSPHIRSPFGLAASYPSRSRIFIRQGVGGAGFRESVPCSVPLSSAVGVAA